MKKFDAIHVFPKGKFTNDYINSINKLFSDKENMFIVYGSSIENIPNYSNTVFIDQFNIKGCLKFFINVLKPTKRIVFHSFFISSKILVIYMLIKKFDFSNTYCCFWGADIYDRINKWNNTNSLSLDDKLYISVYKRLKKICTITNEDYLKFKSFFKGNYDNYKIIYSSPYFDDSINDYVTQITRETYYGGRIIIGNSASKNLKHIDVLKLLKEFEIKEINVPLSYGDLEYAKEVELFGENNYKNLFHTLTEPLNNIDYINYINSNDVIIINSKRQIALGNIYYAVLLGLKVIVPFESALDRYLKKEVGIFVWNIEFMDNNVLSTVTVEEIKKLEKNKEIMKKMLCKNNFEKIWNKVLFGGC